MNQSAGLIRSDQDSKYRNKCQIFLKKFQSNNSPKLILHHVAKERFKRKSTRDQPSNRPGKTMFLNLVFLIYEKCIDSFNLAFRAN